MVTRARNFGSTPLAVEYLYRLSTASEEKERKEKLSKAHSFIALADELLREKFSYLSRGFLALRL